MTLSKELSNTMRTLPLVLAVLVLGCPGPKPCDPDDDSCTDGGQPPPDVCNSREEALSSAECALTLGQPLTGYISFSGDQDWYLAQLPSGLTARSLLHVSAGYGAPNTAVNLSVNVLKEDGSSSLAQKTDKH